MSLFVRMNRIESERALFAPEDPDNPGRDLGL
jgi:hypothetical protein